MVIFTGVGGHEIFSPGALSIRQLSVVTVVIVLLQESRKGKE
mgnify:CR=1 FL=1